MSEQERNGEGRVKAQCAGSTANTGRKSLDKRFATQRAEMRIAAARWSRSTVVAVCRPLLLNDADTDRDHASSRGSARFAARPGEKVRRIENRETAHLTITLP